MEAFQDEKTKKKDCRGSAEDEQKKLFWRQSNQEFLAEKKRNGTGVSHSKETQTCTSAMKLVTLHGIVQRISRKNREFLRNLKEK
ncbi:hypothetical protein HanPI659440_Chr12g0469281 [Helianthus annuus]|nr:hypothetical protein HanPI659440_Chr12g0469281 [Helianthus annuus]